MAKRKTQRVGNEKNYDYYFLLCSRKKSRPLGPTTLCLSRSLSFSLWLYGMHCLPFWTCRSHCTLQKVAVAATAAAAAVSYLLFLPLSPPAVAIMHYYYPAAATVLDHPDIAPSTLRTQIYFPTENWKLLHEINFMQLKHLIFTNSLIDFASAAAAAHFALDGKLWQKVCRNNNFAMLCCSTDALSGQGRWVYLQEIFLYRGSLNFRAIGGHIFMKKRGDGVSSETHEPFILYKM